MSGERRTDERYDDRDEIVNSVLSDLRELADRPSQHSAAWIRQVADRANEAVRVLHADLRGWENESKKARVEVGEVPGER